MFTKQAAGLNQRLTDSVGQQAADAIMSVLGDCQADLVHRGTVTLDASGQDGPVVRDSSNPEAMFAPLRVLNRYGAYDLQTGAIDGGPAAVFQGPVVLQANSRDPNSVALIARDQGGILDTLFANDVKKQDGTAWLPCLWWKGTNEDSFVVQAF